VVKRITKIIRVDVTNPWIINYTSFYKITIKATKLYKVLRQLNREVVGIIPIRNKFLNRLIQKEI